MLGGAAVVGVVVSLVLTRVVDSGDDDGKGSRTIAAGSTSPGPTDVSPSPSPSPSVDTGTASPSASAPGLPVGYQLYEDPERFRIAYPDGWSRSTAPSSYGMDIVYYNSADREHRVQVYQVEETSPKASFDKFLHGSAKSARFPGDRPGEPGRRHPHRLPPGVHRRLHQGRARHRHLARLRRAVRGLRRQELRHRRLRPRRGRLGRRAGTAHHGTVLVLPSRQQLFCLVTFCSHVQ
ncbi:hypothetical protein ACRAWF_34140 [Streptomyces sp. L7]